MMPIKKVIEKLKEFPEDAWVYAYEGEITGICIVSEDGTPLGEILCNEYEGKKDGNE